MVNIVIKTKPEEDVGQIINDQMQQGHLNFTGYCAVEDVGEPGDPRFETVIQLTWVVPE